jgi:hypothetical protein
MKSQESEQVLLLFTEFLESIMKHESEQSRGPSSLKRKLRHEAEANPLTFSSFSLNPSPILSAQPSPTNGGSGVTNCSD